MKRTASILQDFHDLTKLTLTLYNPEGEWILSLSGLKENCFYHYIKTSRKVLLSDLKLPTMLPLNQPRHPVNVVIYNVSPGLIEATAPIVSDGFNIITYLMMGQVAKCGLSHHK